MGLFDKVWEKEEWDKPGYNPKNGKVRALFRWEGCKPFRYTTPTSQVYLLNTQGYTDDC
jgi:hypothetical protein